MCAPSLFTPAPLCPHLLEVLDDHHVGIHIAIDAVLHASILASGESALRHAASDALFEADGVEFVDGCRGALACESIKDMHTPVSTRRMRAVMEVWTYWTEPVPSGSRQR